MISNNYHIPMSSSSTPTTSPKLTLASTHPRFTSTLVNILLSEFKTIRRFAELARIHPTYFYAFLRDGKGGVIPRLHTVTNLMKTVKEHAPHRFETLMEALRVDIEAGEDSEVLESADRLKRVTAEAWRRNGWGLPRPSIAKRFQLPH